MQLFKYRDVHLEYSSKIRWKEDRYFRYFKILVVFLTVLFMLISVLRRPIPYEKPGMKMVFTDAVKKNMQRFALKVPLYSEPSSSSEVKKYYFNVDETFVFLQRAKGPWIKVADMYSDTGWIYSYFLRQKPGSR
ncbi:MAG: SH3 domain-containing protein [candidate division WOR-3 bacterium]